jgi:phage replication-related protein YjqB (UPF0714/DUF867 family)
MDKYANFKALEQSEIEGIDYEIQSRNGISSIAVIAPHGGGIEPGTAEITKAIAGSDHTFYSFKGTKKSGNIDLHISSTKFDEPRGIRVIETAETALTIHGCREIEEIVFIGGLNQDLTEKIQTSLTQAGFKTAKSQAQKLEGINPDNICNRGRTGQGAQLEISKGLREQMFGRQCYPDTTNTTVVFHEFVSAVRDAIL